eukprot:13412.XXX_650767_651952_1 [CDS] Oithona nana genome sequencing.
MSSIEQIFLLLSKMGCLCTKQSIRIEGVNYANIEKIGEGGFSSISLIEDRRSRKRYALKKITCHSTEDQIQAKKEIEYHKKFDHPNILALIGSEIKGQADIVHDVTSVAYLVLPYFSRGTLADELSKREKTQNHFSEHAALILFLQICEAIQHLHESEGLGGPFAHRDIKPHNVLLREDIFPVIMDLGSVEVARVKVRTHSDAQYLQDMAAERCSMPYRAPELYQVDSKCDIDERTDIWSLGCLLYAIAFFKSPFDIVLERGDSVALAVQSGPSNAKFPKNSPFSKGFQDLILWMLTVDLQKRPFINDVITKVALLIETSEDQL